MAHIEGAHDRLRPLMFSIAYRMLGSVTEAEDVVQDAFLRMHTSAAGNLRSPDAYAATVTTRLAIDALRAARTRREHYAGPWLPEPLVEAGNADPAQQIEMDETVSVAFLMVLERLSPVERAVFLLREVFGYDYARIASVTGQSQANCRQVLRRARQHVRVARPRFEPSAAERDRLAARFFAAIRHGDVAALEAVLAGDAIVYADGGGKAPAAPAPVRGAVQVGRFLLGLARMAERLRFSQQPVHVNGQPGMQFFSPSGEILGVLSLGICDGHVAAAYNQINPDKLRHLGTVGDLAALMSGNS